LSDQDSASNWTISVRALTTHLQLATLGFHTQDSASRSATSLLKPRFGVQLRDFDSPTNLPPPTPLFDRSNPEDGGAALWSINGHSFVIGLFKK
jgi:hypothetical protein